MTVGVATAEEREQALRLAHRVFAEELGLKPRQADGRLADDWFEDAVCLVARAQGQLVGMITVGTQRPFSIDAKLPELERYLPPSHRLAEVRLLAVEPPWRGGTTLYRLSTAALAAGRAADVDRFVCSAMLDRIALYARIGWRPFGPLLGSPEWPLQAMTLTPADLTPLGRRLLSNRMVG